MGEIGFRLNGVDVRLAPRAGTVAGVLREELGLTGTKLVCGAGTCGACVIRVDGVPVASCLLPVEELDGREVTTVEGLGDPEDAGGLHPVQKAFLAHDGLQCGFCTSGFVLEAVAFYERWRELFPARRPTREEVASSLAGHLCRCGAYDGIITAVQAACAGDFDGVGEVTPVRPDALAKVTGTARYTVDVHLPGMLLGRIVRSSEAHAEVLDVDVSGALALPGVRGYVDLMGKRRVVRYVGQPIGAIAAEDRSTARRAVERIDVTYAARPAAAGMEAARAQGAPELVGWWIPPSSSEGPAIPNVRRGNVLGPTPIGSVRPVRARRLVGRARREGDPLLVENTWATAVQSHTAFEPHAAVAEWTGDDRLVLYLSTQGVSQSRERLAAALDMPVEHLTVRAEHVGGAFGAKQGHAIEAVAAARLARAVGAPVMVAYDRAEELAYGGNRPGTDVRAALLGGPDGSPRAITMGAHTDGGASAGSLVATTVPRFAYPGVPKALLDYDVVSNAPPGTPFRAPGGPPALFALEQAVDELALRLGDDPVGLRRRWSPRPLRTAVYDRVEQRPLWRGRTSFGSASGRFRRGVGVAFGTWFYGYDPSTRVTLRSGPAGFSAQTAAQDLGTGTRAVVAAGAAAALGIDGSEVVVTLGESGDAWGPTSSASRTTASVWPAAHAAGLEMGERLAEAAREHLGLTGADVVPGGVTHAGELIPWSDLLRRLPPLEVTAGRPRDERSLGPFVISHVRFGWGFTEAGHVVEVEVDTRLGRVRVCRVDAVIAAGRVHVPALARSQALGGVVQGIGMALHEERLLDPVLGLVVSTNLDLYHIPGIADAPEIAVEFIEDGFDHVPGGGVGLGEVAFVGVPAAVANAVAAALGVRLRRLPMTPDRVLEALG